MACKMIVGQLTYASHVKSNVQPLLSVSVGARARVYRRRVWLTPYSANRSMRRRKQWSKRRSCSARAGARPSLTHGPSRWCSRSSCDAEEAAAEAMLDRRYSSSGGRHDSRTRRRLSSKLSSTMSPSNRPNVAG